MCTLGAVTPWYNNWESSECRGKWTSSFLFFFPSWSLQLPFHTSPVLPQERCKPANWKTSKHPLFSWHMSCHSSLMSPSERTLVKITESRAGVSVHVFAHTTLSCCWYQRPPFAAAQLCNLRVIRTRRDPVSTPLPLLPYIKEKGDGKLPYNTGSSAWYSVTT